MSLYNAKNVEFSFGAELLFRGVSFEIERNDKIGLVGRNGCGKTTLFKLMRGELIADAGELVKSQDAVLGYMEQHVVRDSSVSMYDEVLSVFAPLLKLEEQLEALHREIDSGLTDPERLEKQMRLTERFEAEGGLTCRARARSSLLGLGFPESEQEKPVSVLSGGEKAKVQLAKLLLSGANLLLLDEPTNHLDLAASAWLEKFLLEYRGAYLVISHDRYFLDKVTGRTFELENNRLTAYKGGYTRYREKKEEDLEAAWKHYENQMEEIRRIEGIIEQQKRFNQAHNYITIASKEKQIERLRADLVKPETPPKKLRFRFHCNEPVTEEILTAKNLSISFGGDPLFRGVDLTVRKRERVFLLGENGCGKTTLFKILTKEYAGDTGTVVPGSGVKVGYYDQLMTGLSDRKTVLDELWDAYPKLTQTEARTALGSFLFVGGEEVFKKIGTLSGGEKARIALLKLMMSGCNLLLLDEPTNHLDITSREALEAAIEGFDGTALIISHDRYLIRRTATRCFRLTPEGIETVEDMETLFEETSEQKLAVKKENTGGSTAKTEYLRKKERQSELRKQKTRAARAEERIAALEEEVKRLNDEMQKPENAADFERIAALGEALAETQKELDEQTEEWIAASEELAELEEEE